MESYSDKSEPLTADRYLQRLPPKVRRRLQKRLKNEERLLWAEWTGITTPGDLWYWLKLAAPGFLKAIFWTGLTSLALLIAGFVTRIDFLVECGSFFLICLFLLMAAFWLAARGTVYALTDGRAMVVSPVNFTSYSEIDPTKLKIVEYASDLTSFYLEQESYKSTDGDEHAANFEIYARTDAAHLKQLLLNNFPHPVEQLVNWPEIAADWTNDGKYPHN